MQNEWLPWIYPNEALSELPQGCCWFFGNVSKCNVVLNELKKKKKLLVSFLLGLTGWSRGYGSSSKFVNKTVLWLDVQDWIDLWSVSDFFFPFLFTPVILKSYRTIIFCWNQNDCKELLIGHKTMGLGLRATSSVSKLRLRGGLTYH